MEKSKSRRALSRVICIVAGLVLYILGFVALFDGYFIMAIWPIYTVIFLVASVTLYFPTRTCIEGFFNLQQSKIKRVALLLIVLIPYTLGIGCCIFEIAASSPRAYASRAERDFENYKEMYDQNAELLNYINDNIVKEPTADNVPCISSLSYYPYSGAAERTRARIYYDVDEFEDRALSTIEHLSFQDKESIRKLMEDMSIGERGTSFAHNEFRIELMHNAGVMFIKAPEEKKIYRGEYYAGFQFLDDKWQLVAYQYPPA